MSATNETMTAWEGLTQSDAYASSRLMKIDARMEPAEVAHAADDHHDEGFQDPVDAHRVVDADEGTEEHAAGGRHAGPDGEDHGVDERHGDAHGRRP